MPAFQIELKMLEPCSLEQQVGFIGVTPEGTSIVLTREPKLSTGSPTRFGVCKEKAVPITELIFITIHWQQFIFSFWHFLRCTGK